MSKHYFEIKFFILGQLSTEKSVIVQVLPLDFFHNFSFINNGFIKCHEYSNKFIFVSAHKVKVICLSIALISSLYL